MVEEPAVTHEWTIADLTAPDTTITLNPPASARVATTTFGFSSNEADATFECALDTPAGEEPAWNDCAEPPANAAGFADLATGDHALLVRAADPTGNVDATPASHDGRSCRTRPPTPRPAPTVEVTSGAATVTFTDVSGAGTTATDALEGDAPLPPGYTANDFYEVGTTAQYLEVASVCIEYDQSAVADAVRLLHFDGSEWIDVTTTDADGVVCGEPGELGAFATAERDDRRRARDVDHLRPRRTRP